MTGNKSSAQRTTLWDRWESMQGACPKLPVEGQPKDYDEAANFVSGSVAPGCV